MFLIPLLLLIAFFQLIISLGIALESRRSNSTVQKLFAAMCTTIFFWTLTNIFLLYVETYANASNLWYFNFANKLGFALGGLSILFIYLFSAYFPVRKVFKFMQKFVLGLGLVVVASAPFDVVSGHFIIESALPVYIPGPLSFLFALFALVVTINVYVDNAKSLRKRSDKKLKSQVATLTAGLTLTIVHAIVFIIVLPLVLGDATIFYAIGYCAPFFYTGLTIYGLVRQNLFDIRLVIARSVAYILVGLTFAVIYSVIVFSLSLLIFAEDDLKLTEQLFYIVTALFIGVSFQPLKKFFDKKTNNLFYRDAYDPQVFLDELNKELVSNIDLEPLLEKCARVIESNIKAEFCLFGLKETAYSEQRIIGTTERKFDQADINFVREITPHIRKTVIVTDDLEEDSPLKSKFRKYDIAIVARLTTELSLEIEGIGYLVLGQKKSGNPYNKQDLRVIEIVANELVIAIQNALRFEEIQKFNITLQEKIDKATAELRRTNEKLKALDETKDEFISMASHQLRTPLTSVKGYLSMVLEGDTGDVPEMQRKMLDQAFVSSQRMVYLIADLLNVSRLRTGKFIIEQQPTQLADVVDEEVTQLQETAKARNLTLHYKKPADFPVLPLDETKIRQVCMNFLDNAIYYTPSGGEIKAELTDNGKVIEYKVIDNGIGISKWDQPRLFTKFYRAGNAKKARPDGTGLGLFMAKKVIVASGGSIIFNSVEGKGSTFGFSFEKAKLEEMAAEQAKKDEVTHPKPTELTKR